VPPAPTPPRVSSDSTKLLDGLRAVLKLPVSDTQKLLAIEALMIKDFKVFLKKRKEETK